MLRTLSLLCVPALVSGVMVFPDTPPKGFNSFDHYKGSGLNQTKVIALAKQFADDYLAHGYDTFTMDSGWSTVYDVNGVPIADPARYPDFKGMVDEIHAMGLKMGLYAIRGVLEDVAGRTPSPTVKGTNYTLAEMVDQNRTGGAANGSCHWASAWLGINASHPGAAAYYQSRVDQMNAYGVDFIKCDCMMCSSGGCYYGEMELFSNAVRNVDRSVVLSYSPGGQNHPDDGKWAADNEMCGMYRVTTDFHGGWGGWGGVQQSLFIAGNFSAANLNGYKNTYPDLDMMSLAKDNWNSGAEKYDRSQTIATLWMIARSPLMEAGHLPADNITLSYTTNTDALEFHDHGVHNRVIKYEGNCTCKGETTGSCNIVANATGLPCVATWLAELASGDKAFAVFNMGETNATVATAFSDLGLGKDAYTLKNIWTKESSQHTTQVPSTLRPHESVFYRVM